MMVGVMENLLITEAVLVVVGQREVRPTINERGTENCNVPS